MKDTVAIVFSGGSYGTYLEWCLTTLTSDANPTVPFTEIGNSHNFKGHHLQNIDGWRRYVRSPAEHQFVRLHPKTKNTDSIAAHINEISKDTRKIIYLQPDQQTVLLVVNNFFYKIWDSWIDHSFNTAIDANKIYSNWPVSRDVPVTEIPRWIMREFLSFYLMPAWFDQTEFHSDGHIPAALTIAVSDLLFKFPETLSVIKNAFSLEYQQPVSVIEPIHQTNLQLQKYLLQDKICNSIIDSVRTNTTVSWPNLTLPSEAWVQWKLRNCGLEIRCDGLDIFPTSSVQLRELLYPI